MQISQPNQRLISLAAQIVSAHVGNNRTPTDALPGLIKDVYTTLASIGGDDSADDDHMVDHPHFHRHAPAPRAPIATGNGKYPGVADDHLVCLEDGLTMKMLKRHLITVHGLTPDQYRKKWNLPADYPMVSAKYATLRSSLAKESGLGLRPEARKRLRG